MDGIDALRAMKEGKTVIMYRNDDHSYNNTDTYYRFDFKFNYDTCETSKHIWSKMKCHKYWHECTNPATFWIVSNNFEIAEEVD